MIQKFQSVHHSMIYTSVQSPNYLFRDDGDGSIIDLTKWDVSNLNPNWVTFEQSKDITNKITGITTNEKWHAIVMNSLPTGSRVGMYNNEIRSKVSITDGFVRFSLCNLFRTNNWVRIGLTDMTNLNRIELSAYATNSLKFSIWKAGVEVYSIASGAIDFGQFKLCITKSNIISAWILNNDTWIQIGTSQTHSLGTLKFSMSSEGAFAGLTSIRDIYITDKDFSTIIPDVENATRAHGEVPDGTTDNSIALNAALVLGNVTLENGVFAYSDSLKIPSNRTLTLRNAKLWKLNDSLDNGIRNSDFDGGNINVKVKGLGNAILDANAAGNDDGYETYSDMLREDPWDWTKLHADFYKYVNIPIVNVIGLEISGLYIFNMPHWNIIMHHVKQGIIKNCLIMYKPLLVPANTDCFNPMWGCENIDIYNIKTLSDDDTCYLGCNRSNYAVVQQGPARVGDVKNINIQDITVYSTGGRGLLLSSSEGNKVTNIHWSNIKIYSCYHALLIHYPDYYVIDPAKEDMMDIIIDNVTVEANANPEIIKVNDKCKNITITNLTNNSGKADIAFEAGLVAADIENFTIEGVLQTP